MTTSVLLRCTLTTSFAAMLVTAGCGKKGPLLYPDSLIAQPPQYATVMQRGAALKLTFAPPRKDLAGRPLQDVEAVRVLRRVCRVKDCSGCQEPYLPLQRIALAYPGVLEQEEGRFSWLDSDVHPGETFQYRLQAEQKDGVIGAAVDTAPALVGAMVPPPRVTASAAFGGVIRIVLGGEVPQGTVLVGYRLLRAAGQEALQPLVSLLAGTDRYEDQAVQVGGVYRYAARLVVKRSDGLLVESDLSSVVTVSMIDPPE